jgi:hypothetical protein
MNRRVLWVLLLFLAWRCRDGLRGQVSSTSAVEVTVDFSLQPLQSFLAVFGGRLVKVAEYSSETCNHTLQPISRSQGMVKQLAGEIAQINVVDFANSVPTAARAQAKSKTAVAVSVVKLGLTGLSVGAAVAAALASAPNVKLPAEVAAGGAVATAGLQAIQVPLNNAQTQKQQTADSVLKTLLNPNIMMNIAPGACEEHAFFGEYISGFKPVRAVLK